MAAAAPALALEEVTVTFVSPDATRYTAVRDTTLRVEPGEFVSVVGPTTETNSPGSTRSVVSRTAV